MREKLKLCKLLAKKEERLGRERKKDDGGGFLCLLNYPFQRNRNSDWLATSQSVKNSVNKKSLSLQGVHFSHVALRDGGQKRCFETCKEKLGRKNS